MKEEYQNTKVLVLFLRIFIEVKINLVLIDGQNIFLEKG